MLRYKFRCRRQRPSESGENFILAVKLLAESCEFGAFRDSAIRDQLVFGVYNRELQKRLLNEEGLDVRSAERIIKGFEMANSNTQYFHSESGENQVNSVRYRLGARQPRVDKDDRTRSRSRDRAYIRNQDSRNNYRRYEGRSRSDHRSSSRGIYANFVCQFCKRRGHIQKNCYRYIDSQKNSVKFVKEERPEKDEQSTGDVHDYFKRLRVEYDSDTEEEGDYPCLMISSIKKISKPCLIEANIEGQSCQMEVDSGSAVSVMSKLEFKKQFRDVKLKNSARKLIVINGSNLEILRKALVTVFWIMLWPNWN